jgi:hypothetical protein
VALCCQRDAEVGAAGAEVDIGRYPVELQQAAKRGLGLGGPVAV